MLVFLSENGVDEADYLTFESSFWSLLATEDQASSIGKVCIMALILVLLRVSKKREGCVCVYMYFSIQDRESGAGLF